MAGKITLPKLISMAKVEKKQVKWLVPEYIPKGHIAVMAGDGGIAAALSSGSRIFF
ncbi:MAG: hypothetical protein OSJ45_14055 [Lachnospiraceae bacterium]|nr:hypothetical protein [Lachnospiraceae bacterium]